MSTFEQFLRQAGVSLDKRGNLAKEFRNCEAQGRIFTAVRALIDSMNSERARAADAAKEDVRELARENSKANARIAQIERELKEMQVTAIRRGLEALPEVSEQARKRLLTVNGD